MLPGHSVTQYLTDLRAIRLTGSATAETSFYPPIDRLLNAAGQKLTPTILFSTQLRNQGAGMPDGGFFPQPARQRRNAEPLILQNPERGVVEIKPADYNLDALTKELQTLRYLKQYGLVLITNLREFRLLQLTAAGKVQTLEQYTLATTPSALWSDPLTSFTRQGIVCFISNNAWLDGLSHPTMRYRYRYLHTFQSLFIDNLNGDKYRTGKTTPEGHPDPSAFSTPQNREGISC